MNLGNVSILNMTKRVALFEDSLAISGSWGNSGPALRQSPEIDITHLATVTSSFMSLYPHYLKNIDCA